MPFNAPDGGPLVADTIASSARMAERVGFDSLWAFDAIGRGFLLPDPLIAVSVAAAATSANFIVPQRASAAHHAAGAAGTTVRARPAGIWLP